MTTSPVAPGRAVRPRPGRRVAVLDLLADAPPQSLGERLYASHFRRQFTSIMPQAISVWCRQAGHDVHYAAYHGQAEPHTLVPTDCDVAFVCAYTKAAPLAYALARLFRRDGTLTILGGPHARSFPDDALRFFDWVVGDCDRRLVEELIEGRYDVGLAVSSGRTLAEFPTVEERMPELRASSLSPEGRTFWQAVPLLSSVGCPYDCDFCVDWDSRYMRVPDEHLRNDLEYLADHHPKVLVGFHDPNFAVQFDATMDVLESVDPERRLPYVMESSLSVLKDHRLARLRDTRCAYIAAGIESWEEYSGKAGAGRQGGRDKLEAVSARFTALRDHVEGFQGNFVLGTDADRGRAPAELTREFIRRHPEVWPGVNIPTPFGGTPLFDELLGAGRILRRMPFLTYYNPYLVFVPGHYDPVEFYDLHIEVFEEMIGAGAWRRRITGDRHWLVKAIHSVQAAGAWAELREFRRIRRLLVEEPAFRSFHEGADVPLPDFYRRRFDQRLGRYAELLDEADRTPCFDADPDRRVAWTRGAGAVPEALREPAPAAVPTVPLGSPA